MINKDQVKGHLKEAGGKIEKEAIEDARKP